MGCGCIAPDKTNLWTPIPDYRQPTDILKGENIDCYAQRAGTVAKNDVAEHIENRIENTSVTSNLSLEVNETFKLTPTSTKTASSWTITVNGKSLAEVLPSLTFSGSTLSGKVRSSEANKPYKILITALGADGEIDAREFNFFPKEGGKEETVKFVFPFSPGGRVTCKFGPRKPPAPGASSMHKGIDISAPTGVGTILSAGDGTVVKCGPASGFGNWVVIEHRDAKDVLVATTVYGHMNEIYVKVGQKVAAGQAIAKEGNAGIGSAAHLHFEMHKGAWGNPVDPLPYINGNFVAAENNLPGENGQPDPNSFVEVKNSNKGMTSAEVSSHNTDCPKVLPNQAPPSSDTNPEPVETLPLPANFKNKAANRSTCAPAEIVPVDKVLAEINRALNEDATLTAEDKKFILQVAKIESNLDPYAKNPSSSATGLYQMLDVIAVKYYGLLQRSPTCENRCDPYLATKAMMLFYTREFKPYWDGFNQSGKTKIANKSIQSTAWSAQYGSFTQGEFMYGLLHHDGVGNAVKGIDKQGVDYWRKKIRGA